MKRVIVLGSTGSIGEQTLAVLLAHPEQFQLVGVTFHQQSERGWAQVAQFPTLEAVGTKAGAAPAFFNGQLFTGSDYVEMLIAAVDADIVVNAITGFAGLAPSLRVLERGADLALANKETLVVGGELVLPLAAKTGARIIPIDSEHSAIYQCLVGERQAEVAQVVLTCSGGAARAYLESDYPRLTPAQILAHPNWQMGPKITVDSSTLVNKAFEMIEAHYLFNLAPEQIKVVLHPESYIHSYVQFRDGSIKALMGPPDMKLALAYALSAPFRIEQHPELNLPPTLHFDEITGIRAEMLALGARVIREKGTLGAAFNACSEVLVAAFLKGELHFMAFFDIIIKVVNSIKVEPVKDLEQLQAVDAAVRNLTQQIIKEQL